MSDQYCENDYACRPACHTEECIKLSVRKHQQNNPGRVAPFERIRTLEAKCAWQAEMLERAVKELRIANEANNDIVPDRVIREILTDLEKGP